MPGTDTTPSYIPLSEVYNFLKTNPKNKDLSPDDFKKVMDDPTKSEKVYTALKSNKQYSDSIPSTYQDFVNHYTGDAKKKSPDSTSLTKPSAVLLGGEQPTYSTAGQNIAKNRQAVQQNKPLPANTITNLDPHSNQTVPYAGNGSGDAAYKQASEDMKSNEEFKKYTDAFYMANAMGANPHAKPDQMMNQEQLQKMDYDSIVKQAKTSFMQNPYYLDPKNREAFYESIPKNMSPEAMKNIKVVGEWAQGQQMKYNYYRALPNPSVDDRAAIGHIQAESGDLNTAANTFDHIATEYPDSPQGYQGKAMLSVMNNNYPQAIEYLNQALVKNPNDPGTLNLMAQYQWLTGKQQDAIVTVGEAAKNAKYGTKEATDAFKVRAAMNQQLGNTSDATVDMDKAKQSYDAYAKAQDPNYDPRLGGVLPPIAKPKVDTTGMSPADARASQAEVDEKYNDQVKERQREIDDRSGDSKQERDIYLSMPTKGITGLLTKGVYYASRVVDNATNMSEQSINMMNDGLNGLAMRYTPQGMSIAKMAEEQGESVPLFLAENTLNNTLKVALGASGVLFNAASWTNPLGAALNVGGAVFPEAMEWSNILTKGASELGIAQGETGKLMTQTLDNVLQIGLFRMWNKHGVTDRLVNAAAGPYAKQFRAANNIMGSMELNPDRAAIGSVLHEMDGQALFNMRATALTREKILNGHALDVQDMENVTNHLQGTADNPGQLSELGSNMEAKTQETITPKTEETSPKSSKEVQPLDKEIGIKTTESGKRSFWRQEEGKWNRVTDPEETAKLETKYKDKLEQPSEPVVKNEVLTPSKSGVIPYIINKNSIYDAKSAIEAGAIKTPEGNILYRKEPIEKKEMVKGKAVDTWFTSKDKEKTSYVLVDPAVIEEQHINGKPNDANFLNGGQPVNRVMRYIYGKPEDTMNLNPATATVGNTAYEGAPIINGRGEVIQGNGTATLLKEYSKKGDVNGYYDHLRSISDITGISPEKIDKNLGKILVRVSDMEDKRALELSGKTTEHLTEPSMDQNLARVFKDSPPESLRSLPGSTSLEDFLSKKGGAMLADMVKSGKMDASVAHLLMLNDGSLSSVGVEHMTSILRHTLADGAHEGFLDNYKSLPKHLQRSLDNSIFPLLKMGDNAPLKEIQNAVTVLGDMYKTGATDIEKHVSTPDEHGVTAADRLSMRDHAMIDLLHNSNSADALPRFLDMMNLQLEGNESQGVKSMSKEIAMDGVMGTIEGENPLTQANQSFDKYGFEKERNKGGENGAITGTETQLQQPESRGEAGQPGNGQASGSATGPATSQEIVEQLLSGVVPSDIVGEPTITKNSFLPLLNGLFGEKFRDKVGDPTALNRSTNRAKGIRVNANRLIRAQMGKASEAFLKKNPEMQLLENRERVHKYLQYKSHGIATDMKLSPQESELVNFYNETNKKTAEISAQLYKLGAIDKSQYEMMKATTDTYMHDEPLYYSDIAEQMYKEMSTQLERAEKVAGVKTPSGMRTGIKSLMGDIIKKRKELSDKGYRDTSDIFEHKKYWKATDEKTGKSTIVGFNDEGRVERWENGKSSDFGMFGASGDQIKNETNNTALFLFQSLKDRNALPTDAIKTFQDKLLNREDFTNADVKILKGYADVVGDEGYKRYLLDQAKSTMNRQLDSIVKNKTLVDSAGRKYNLSDALVEEKEKHIGIPYVKDPIYLAQLKMERVNDMYQNALLYKTIKASPELKKVSVIPTPDQSEAMSALHDAFKERRMAPSETMNKLKEFGLPTDLFTAYTKTDKLPAPLQNIWVKNEAYDALKYSLESKTKTPDEATKAFLNMAVYAPNLWGNLRHFYNVSELAMENIIPTIMDGGHEYKLAMKALHNKDEMYWQLRGGGMNAISHRNPEYSDFVTGLVKGQLENHPDPEFKKALTELQDKSNPLLEKKQAAKEMAGMGLKKVGNILHKAENMTTWAIVDAVNYANTIREMGRAGLDLKKPIDWKDPKVQDIKNQAIRTAGKYSIDYSLPTELIHDPMGIGRRMSDIMRNRNLSLFAGWTYGKWKVLLNDADSLSKLHKLDPESTGALYRWIARGAMLYGTAKLTGTLNEDKKSKDYLNVARTGTLQPLYDIYRYKNGDISTPQFLANFFHSSPVIDDAMALINNRDMYGKQIYNNDDGHAIENTGDFLRYMFNGGGNIFHLVSHVAEKDWPAMKNDLTKMMLPINVSHYSPDEFRMVAVLKNHMEYYGDEMTRAEREMKDAKTPAIQKQALAGWAREMYQAGSDLIGPDKKYTEQKIKDLQSGESTPTDNKIKGNALAYWQRHLAVVEGLEKRRQKEWENYQKMTLGQSEAEKKWLKETDRLIYETYHPK